MCKILFLSHYNIVFFLICYSTVLLDLFIYFILIKIFSLIYCIYYFILLLHFFIHVYMFFSELVSDPLGFPGPQFGNPCSISYITNVCLFFIYFFNCFLHRLCISKHDERAAAEAKATAVIDEDYRKLGPIK